MPSHLFDKLLVQIGRACTPLYGANQGKLLVIVDVLDANRVLVQGQDIPRQVVSTGDIQLVDAVAKITNKSTTEEVAKALSSSDMQNALLNTSGVKKALKQQKRKSLNDFDRVKVQILKKKKNALLREKLNALVQKSGSEVVKKLAAKNAPLKQ
nr:unnamed protein product [Naegleria fowleri]